MIGGMRDFTGKRFGRLNVQSLSHIKSYGNGHSTKSFWGCTCDCGNKVIVAGEALTQGRQKSCGCLSREKAAERLRTHGLSNSPTYNSWASMKTRIANHTKYDKDYYMGVSLHPSWQIFKNFLSDMGERPKGTTLDRIDPFGNYEPSNCRWVTHKEQMLNQRKNTGMFERFISLEPVVTYKLYRQRMRLGWRDVKAARTPKMKNQFR